MMRYLIIDDEQMAHDIIKEYAGMVPEMELLAHCYDAFEALRYLREHKVDLIFLDINMPKLKGFAFLRTLSAPPKVIVTTAYSEFALEGYELNVTDYLLKPFSFERFLKAVIKAVDTLAPTPVQQPATPGETDKRLFLQADKKLIQVAVGDILCIEASGNYCKVITEKGTILTRETLTGLTQRLPAGDFVQVHRSFFVALSHITSIEGNRVFAGRYELPIGRAYRAGLLEVVEGK
ncbi:LytR/AlgR family response regulator transcription factor [Roseivirga sp. BDSF3-8]|uniref:LytR/AlgR family response regulator transcription factor n=1 Tax=Roseivirga sp. BDSF3-8 TaxID=3241598 RepID=UPI003531D78F